MRQTCKHNTHATRVCWLAMVKTVTRSRRAAGQDDDDNDGDVSFFGRETSCNLSVPTAARCWSVAGGAGSQEAGGHGCMHEGRADAPSRH